MAPPAKENSDGGVQWSSTLEIAELEFGPTRDEEFTLQAFGLSDNAFPKSPTAPWLVWITAAGALVSLIGCLTLFGVSPWIARKRLDEDGA